MSYNAATDFVGLFRAISGGVQKGEMPGLDFVIEALARANIITVTASSIAPVANQATTAWLNLASPSYSAEGVFELWNGAAYVAATPALLATLVLNSLGATQGSVLYRNANTWAALAPGTAGQLLRSAGAAANPTFAGLTTVTNTLGGDVALNNITNFFDGPSCAQGTSGVWLATGQVLVQDTGGAAAMTAKLWDGTTVMASTIMSTSGANALLNVPLSGIITNPAANIRISVKDATAVTGKILFNNTGLSKDSTLTVTQIG